MWRVPLALGIASIAVFGLLLGVFFAWRELTPGAFHERRYQVFERAGNFLAVSDDKSFHWFDSIVFVLVFVPAVPYFVFRYGWAKSALLILLPFLGSGIGALAATALDRSNDARHLLGLGILVVLRAVVGVVVGTRAQAWRRQALLRRGWVMRGTSTANRARAAVKEIQGRSGVLG